MKVTANLRIDTDAQAAAFGRCLGAGHARRYAALDASPPSSNLRPIECFLHNLESE